MGLGIEFVVRFTLMGLKKNETYAGLKISTYLAHLHWNETHYTRNFCVCKAFLTPL